MAYMTWSKEWDTGIPIIDRQHSRLVDLINELYQARTVASRQRAVDEVLRELIEYTQSHFLFEEEMLAEAGYPFVESHKRVHRVFIRNVVDYQARLNAGEDVAREVSNMLEQWVVHHIKREDADYAPLIKAQLRRKERASQGWLGATLGRFFRGRDEA